MSPTELKVDYKRKLKELYTAPRGVPALVEVPELTYLMVDGNGDPAGSTYRQAVEALYAVSYTLKFILKQAPDGLAYAVMPLESLWSAAGESPASAGDRSGLEWTAMILQPDRVTPERVADAVAKATRKKPLPAAARLRLSRHREGLAAQILHVGPYAAERPIIDRLHAFIAERGFAPAGRHHEIYLNDPNRAEPDKLQTVIRQPVTSRR